MSTGLNANSPIVNAFYGELLRQGLAVLVILFAVAVAWSVLRSTQLRRASAIAATQGTGPMGVAQGAQYTLSVVVAPEPAARRLLRVSFGLLWLLDGLLQAQPAMPLGMGPGVIQPAAASSPIWVKHLDNGLVHLWSHHPVAAPAAAVWTQVGIGLWMLAASRGIWSRLGGLASAAWGCVVWVFGEALGGIFSPGLTWVFGAPGAVVFYCVAGGLVALPDGCWSTARIARWLVLRPMGLFWVAMALLQAWPGRGFWQGGTTGRVAVMAKEMASVSQPHILSSWVADFGRFDAAHGWGTNLFVVVALASLGAAFVSARPKIVRWAVCAGTALCTADWALVQDFGIFGGVGTDPNSMVPMAMLLVAGYLAITRVPPDAITAPAATVPPLSAGNWREKLAANPTLTFRTIAAVAALGVVLVGQAPAAVAVLGRW